MLGYTLSRNELPGRKIINFLVFFTLLFNGGMVPTYLLYVNTLHVKNTIFALLLPNNILVNGFNVLLVRTYFNNNTPKELIESAMVDGAKEFRIFFSIIMPISKPILATVRGANLIRELVVEQNGMIREGRILQTLGWPRSFLYLKQLDCLLIADEEFAESTGRLELFDLCEGKRLWEKRMPRAYQIYNGEYNDETER